MRTCAVCGKKIVKRDICNDCYKLWCIDGYPDWIKQLISMQSHFERTGPAVFETSFSDSFDNDDEEENLTVTKGDQYIHHKQGSYNPQHQKGREDCDPLSPSQGGTTVAETID